MSLSVEQQVAQISESISELEAVAIQRPLTPLEQVRVYELRDQLRCAQRPEGHIVATGLDGLQYCLECEHIIGMAEINEPVGKTVVDSEVAVYSSSSDFGQVSVHTQVSPPVAVGQESGVSSGWRISSGGTISVPMQTGTGSENGSHQQTRDDCDPGSSHIAQGINVSWIGDFNNASGLEFTNIDSEEYREYTFPQEQGQFVVRIEKPLKLHVSESGGHRIWDSQGISHYIKPGWVHLTWKARQGQPHFVK